MLLYRIGHEGFYAAAERLGGEARFLHSDPFETRPGGWEYGATVELQGLLAPVVPGKVIGVGRNYGAHAAELGNEAPAEPIVFLKPPSSVIGPRTPVLLPPESADVEFEGEIAVVIGERVRRVDAAAAAAAILGVTCAVDVTARDLQRRDATWARGKGFDTFCPLGPAILLDADLGRLAVVTRINGEERQRASTSEMAWGPAELVSWVSQTMTLEAGDVLLTGTPAGVGRLAAGDRIEVEVCGVGVLENPVEVEA